MAAEPPVLPDAQEARRWAADELAKPEYVSAEPGWLEDQWRRFLDWLASLDGPSTADGGLAAPLIGVAIVVLVAVAIIVARPRLNARTKNVQEVFDGDTPVSASDYRASANAAAGRGDWGTAVVQRFRALVRSAEDRDVVDARPGRTADEVARELAGVFVPESLRLGWAAGTFDRLRYGHGTADPADYAAMADLDAALQSLKPGGIPVSAGGAP